MAVEDPSVTFGHIATSLAIYNGPVDNYVPPPSPSFGKNESHFITTDKLMMSVPSINFKDFLQKRLNTVQYTNDYISHIAIAHKVGHHSVACTTIYSAVLYKKAVSWPFYLSILRF